MMIRACFAKRKCLRYISHLELLDTFRRAIRRAKLPGKYSEGYNPTLNLSLSQPLPVGMPGGGEYLDLELFKEVAGKDFVKRLNFKLPAGIEVLEAKFVKKDKLDSLQAIVDRARYIIEPPISSEPESRELLKKFRDKEKIMVTRKRRNKDDREYELRSMVHEIELLRGNKWSVLVSTGSRGNVRPQEILKGLRKINSDLPEVPVIDFYREGMYVSRNGEILTPLADEILEER